MNTALKTKCFSVLTFCKEIHQRCGQITSSEKQPFSQCFLTIPDERAKDQTTGILKGISCKSRGWLKEEKPGILISV